MASQSQAAGKRPGVSAVVAGPSRAVTGNRVVVRTSAGRVAGERAGRVAVFRGVPYAAPPVGALRFASPRPPVPWSGVREAVRFTDVSFQSVIPNRPVPPSDEDSLYANVWTPDPGGSRPVLVYVHGGGWQAGAGSLPAYDGARLAHRGDLVVVTFNYRLGVLGFGLHEDLADPETGHFANWGLQDQEALLRWVHANAAAFGGDPGNITVCGTSAGGATAWQLALLPALRGLIRRIVSISPSHVTPPATALTPEDSRTAYEAVARRLGTTVAGLRAVPAAALVGAWDEVFAPRPEDRIVGSGRWYRGPVVDGRTMPAHDHRMPTPDVPVLSVHTSTEGAFYTGPSSPQPAPAPRDDAELVRVVREVLDLGRPGAGDDLAAACATAYRAAAQDAGLPADPLSLWTEVLGDAFFRHQIVRFAERHARLGTSPLYAMEFAHPALPPHFGTPHEATSPFLFGTHRLPQFAPVFGDGPVERLLSDIFVDAVAAFARTSAPHTPNTADWPPFTPGAPSTLVLGGPGIAEVARTPKLAQLGFWDTVGWEPRL
ncbi:carboxylesterase [Streptomyces caelestis]|uniref:Carboxylic ester hydrolase n=2 Tax=Streptomyces TaxID=1883 RepID=A0A0M8QLQ7_9ACTN|nr:MULTISPECIES: carboxylesterase family protein [Streptomyces]KOT33159.1 carboxylesterase [Streptomyces caelestis]KOV36218.1 carboxylesterase [Streptomyces sp. XY152]